MMPRGFDDFIVRVIDHVWEPTNFFEAIVYNRWRMAMVDEMNSISHNWTWQLTKLPV
jgi:hypothetical protein